MMNGNRKGQAIVEMALVLPIFLVVFIGIFDFGRALHCWSNLNYQCIQATRAATKRIHPLIARNVFSASTHPSIENVRAAFWKNQSPLMPQANYGEPVFNGVGGSSQVVEVRASFNLSLYTPIIGRLIGGKDKDGALTLHAAASEQKE